MIGAAELLTGLICVAVAGVLVWLLRTTEKDVQGVLRVIFIPALILLIAVSGVTLVLSGLHVI